MDGGIYNLRVRPNLRKGGDGILGLYLRRSDFYLSVIGTAEEVGEELRNRFKWDC
ncbi:MAG: hypothetical protein Ct9H90mP5_01320 [Acidimicrobiaceae bacterium]|nr:MAG: hypothetical protein Ct9H90mP5_01320 [Acidimicrobiaceae bacterium]